MEEVCYTREAALEKAIEVEQGSFDIYLKAYSLVQDRHARDLIKEIAFEELEHKHTLEKAFFEEGVALHDADIDEGPSMWLTLFLREKPLDSASTPQDIIIYAIHDEKRSIEFYEKMAHLCAGAPMEKLFSRLCRDENNHLTRLEKLYESIYMQAM